MLVQTVDFREVPTLKEIVNNMYPISDFDQILHLIITNNLEDINAKLYESEIDFIYCVHNKNRFNREGAKYNCHLVLQNYTEKYFFRLVTIEDCVNFDSETIRIGCLYHKEYLFNHELKGVTLFVPKDFCNITENDQDTQDLMGVIDHIFFLPWYHLRPFSFWYHSNLNTSTISVIYSHACMMTALYDYVISELIPDPKLAMNKFLKYQYMISSESTRNQIAHVLNEYANYDDTEENFHTKVSEVYDILYNYKVKR